MGKDKAKEYWARFTAVGVMYITITVGLIGIPHYSLLPTVFLLLLVLAQLNLIKEIYNSFKSDSLIMWTVHTLHCGLSYL